MFEKLLNEIEESDMVLVGIGEEASMPFDFNETHDRQFWKQYHDLYDEEESSKIISFYNTMEQALSGKNYFFVTINMDGLIHQSKINPIRVAAPCGNMYKAQCHCPENEGIMDMPEDFWRKDEEIKCPKCNASLEPNVFNRIYYNESGYLKQWNLYHKWLQGTLNKKLLVMEIGCGFSMMSLIRLPFEKIVMINQKAVFYRVNQRFPQITAELKERMISIQENPFVFADKLQETKKSW